MSPRAHLADRVSCIVAGLIVLTPFATALIAWHDGWLPSGDQAMLTINSYITVSHHPPLIGLHSAGTAFTGTGIALYHPGPLQLWLLAAPLHLFAPSPIGALLGSALLSSTALAAALLAAWQIGGRRLLNGTSLLLLIFFHGLGFDLGIFTLSAPLNPPLSAVAFVGFLFSCWALLCGRNWWWPAAIFFGSLTVQSEVAFTIVVATCSLTVAGILSRSYWTSSPAKPGNERRQTWPVAACSIAVAAFCWSGPIYDQFFGSGNFWNLVVNGPHGRTMGFNYALEELLDTLSLPPAWSFQQDEFHRLFVHVGGPLIRPLPSLWEWITAVLFIFIFVWGMVCACRVRDRARIALGSLAIAAIIGGFATSYLMKVSIALHPEYWHGAGAIAWLFVAIFAWDTVANRLRQHGHSSALRIFKGSPLWASLAGVAVLIFSLSFRTELRSTEGTAALAPVATFSRAARPYCRSGEPVVISPSDQFRYFESTGLAAMLQLQGCPIHLTSFRDVFPSPLFKPSGSERVTFIVSRPMPTPKGFRRIAIADPEHPPARYRHYHALGLMQASGSVFLFVRVR